MPARRPLEVVLAERHEVRDGGYTTPCWFWLGAKGAAGYGNLKYKQRTIPAHRAAYETFVGPIPEGLHIDHLCRQPGCINPEHLEPVTKRENERRGIRGLLTTHCPAGHAYDEANTYYYGEQRHCRTCRRDRARRYYHEQRSAA